MVFKAPEIRPPVYDEMVEDMSHVINKHASSYVDPTCMELHFEDLVADCWGKTTEMVNKGLLTRSKTRVEYFKIYRTAIMNHLRTLVGKHRFTEKRTGVKPPPKDQRNSATAVSTKPQEVRIDDPDSGFQLAEADVDSGSDTQAMHEAMEEIQIRLSPLEILVFNQLVSPNERSLFYAVEDAQRGREYDEPLRIRIRHEHLAKGIADDFTPEQFQRYHDSIKKKCQFMKTKAVDDPKKSVAWATLIQFFGVQIPRSVDEKAQARCLLIAAYHQYDRVKDNDGIKQALSTCDIPTPQMRNGKLGCFGVLYQKEQRMCNVCGRKAACELAAANFGLGEITLSPKLLNTHQTRVPVLRPSRAGHETAFSASEREEEILTFLDENFRQVTHEGDICYRHTDRLNVNGMQLVFSIGKQISPLKLRFISPSEELKAKLVLKKEGRPSWYLSDETPAEDALDMMREHARNTFVKV